MKTTPLLPILVVAASLQTFAQENLPAQNPSTNRPLQSSEEVNYFSDELQQSDDLDELSALTQASSNAFTCTPDNITICPGQSVTLRVSTSFSGSTPPGVSSQDDYYSGIVNIGFAFTFYGTKYTKCIIGTNGVISFDTSRAYSFNTWAMITEPTGNPAEQRNTIAVPWQDLHIASSGNLKYSTVGTEPTRIFVVEYCDAAYYGCWGSRFTGQVLLYEGTSNIETHIYQRPVCSPWNSAHATLGVQNAGGNISAVVPGRNASSWSATSEGKRWKWNYSTLNYDIIDVPFAPVGYFSPGTINWYNSSNILIGTGVSYTVPSSLLPGTYVYRAQITTQWCAGPVTYNAFARVIVGSTLPMPKTGGPYTVCSGQSITLFASCDDQCLWYSSSTGGTPLDTGGFTTPALNSTAIYYVGYSSGACNSPRRAVKVNVSPAIPTPVALGNSVCDASVPGTLTANCGVGCQWFTQSTGGQQVGGGSPFITTPPTTSYWVQKVNGYGCTSPRTPVSLTVGNLNVSACCDVYCPIGNQNLTTTVSGQTYVPVSVENNFPSNGAPDNGIDCIQPDDPGCVNNYVTRTLVTPANVANPMTTSSIQSVHVVLYDPLLGGAVGADAKLWLQSPAGTFILLTGNRPFNSDWSLNTCYCPTFTYSGTNDVIPKMDGPYNALNYRPENSLLSFAGENPYVGGGVWTLYLVDPDAWAGGSFGFLEIENFKIIFNTILPSTYSWNLGGNCGALSSSNIPNPVYTPPSITGNYTCNAFVTVYNGSCIGTSSIYLGCPWLLRDGEPSSYGNDNIFTDKENLKIIPNPATDYADVYYECTSDKKILLRLFDYNGKQILSQEIICHEGQKRFPVDVSKSPPGIYLVSITGSSNVYNASFVKQY
jgi:hypothetical protein